MFGPSADGHDYVPLPSNERGGGRQVTLYMRAARYLERRRVVVTLVTMVAVVAVIGLYHYMPEHADVSTTDETDVSEPPPLPPRLIAGNSGVEFADFVPLTARLFFLLRPELAIPRVVIPLPLLIPCTCTCRFRDGRPEVVLNSSLPGDAVRRFVPDPVPVGPCNGVLVPALLIPTPPLPPIPPGVFAPVLGAVVLEPVPVLYAPSQGLVSGLISSKSRSAGLGRGTARASRCSGRRCSRARSAARRA